MTTFGCAVAFIIVAGAATAARAMITTGRSPKDWPWATLALNVAGSAVLGFASTADIAWATNTLFTAAGLGSLTTFSTVVAEITQLHNCGRKVSAATYAGLTLALGTAAAWIGLKVGVAIGGSL